MNPYMFVIISTPSKDNRYLGRIAEGRFHVWVISDSAEDAVNRAYDYIRGLHWEPQEIEHAFEIEPRQIRNLHKDEAALYRQALVHGIAADIIASPIDEGNLGDPYILVPPC